MAVKLIIGVGAFPVRASNDAFYIALILFEDFMKGKIVKLEDLLSLKQFKVWLRTDVAISFLSTFVIGLLVHMYVYTNTYLGHDTTSFYMPDKSWFIRTGRYVYAILHGMLHNSLIMHFFIGIIFLTFLGLSSALISKILKIDKPLLLILVSSLIVTWPAIIDMHCFMFSLASGGAVGIFFACLAAYIADRYRLGFIPGILFIIVSMASYQAFWGVSATLLLFCLVRYSLDSELNTKDIIIKSVKFLTMLALGLLFYYLIWKLVMKHTGYPMTNYLGMDEMGYTSITEFVNTLKYAYSSLLGFYFKIKTVTYYPPYLTFAGLVSILFSLFIVINLYIKQKIYKQPVRTLLLLLCFILLPIAMNCVVVFSKSTATFAATRFPFAFMFLILPMLLSFVDIKKKMYSLVLLISLLSIGLSSINGFYGANVSYLKLVSNYQIAISSVTQLLSRIQSEKDYKVDTPVAIIGRPYGNPLHRTGFTWTVDIRGVLQTAFAHRYTVIGLVKTFSPQINLVDESKYKDSEEVKSLDAFPSHNCIIWIDGVLVLKLS